MDLGLTYKALASNQVDLIAGNSTDGLIQSLGLVVLDDDKHYFPPYDAAVVYRNDIDPKCRAALDSLAGILDDATMRRLNFEVDGRKRPVAEVVREFVSARGAAAGRGTR
jgi:osmoprotectant transport system substrate-binding protein